MLFMMATSLIGILCSTISSKMVSWQPTTEPTFPDHFIQPVGVLCLDTHAPAYHSIEDGALNERLIKHEEHLVVYIEPEPPEDVKPA